LSILTYQGSNTYLPPSIVVPLSVLITGITNSNPMVITVNNNESYNTYIVGQLVYLNIPFDYGMYQANGLTTEIISSNGNNFSVATDSSQFDKFVIPGSSGEQPATLCPAGARNTYNFTTLPFHSLNGMMGN
jgi:hypothetical protein